MKNLLVASLILGAFLNIALAQGIKRMEVSAGESIKLQTSKDRNSSALVISNKSRANLVELVILGAPKSGVTITLNGAEIPSLDEVMTIPPNTPNFKLQVFGDFKGKTLSIVNVTNIQNPATAEVVFAD